MTSAFKIVRHDNSENLHLKLFGDFDGTAAWELINTIKENADRYCKIFVHTCNLSSLDNFREDLLMPGLPSLNDQAGKLVFTGEPGTSMASLFSNPDIS
ncbi:MAG: hypothetical protein R6U29_07435 [Desulfosudaceae bacterium]